MHVLNLKLENDHYFILVLRLNTEESRRPAIFLCCSTHVIHHMVKQLNAYIYMSIFLSNLDSPHFLRSN